MLIELKGNNDLLKLRGALGVTIHVDAGVIWVAGEGKISLLLAIKSHLFSADVAKMSTMLLRWLRPIHLIPV